MCSAPPRDTPTSRSCAAPSGGLALLGVLFLVGFNLRTAMASVPPLLTAMERDLRLGGLVAGLLTGLPVACMGLLAPAAHRLARRAGPQVAVALALTVLTGALGLRLLGGTWQVLYGATLLAGAGIAVVGTVLPAVVKQQFPDRPGTATAAYATAMAVGSALAAGVAVPLAEVLGSWERSLGAWALPAAAALLGWLLAHPGRHGHRRGGGPATRGGLAPVAAPSGLPWRSRTAWLISGYLTAQAALFYSSLAWLAPSYVARGWVPGDAGLLLALFGAAQLVATAVVPVVADRFRDRRPLLIGSTAAAATSLAALAVAPDLAPALWVAVLGLGLGAGFALGLVLLVDHAAGPADSARLAAMAFLISYTLAAAAPALAGALRDASGDFRTTYLTLAALGLGQLTLAARLGSVTASRLSGERGPTTDSTGP